MTQTPDERTAADVVRSLREFGLSRAEIARELGRSERMVSKIERGETSGAIYREALVQLEETGRSVQPVPRRRGRSGELVPVRASRDAETPTVTPRDPATEPRTRRDFKEDTTYLAGGGRQTETQLPRSEGVGREAGRHGILDRMRRGAQGRRRVRFDVEYANGRHVTIGSKGGYNASDALRRSRNEGQDPIAWIGGEAGAIYTELDGMTSSIIGVTETYY